jgi:hypothetical protein
MRTRSQRSIDNKAFALKLTMTAGLGTALLLAACATASKPIPSLRGVTAQRIASSMHMTPAYIPAGEFAILSYDRVIRRGQPITVYIEGDGAESQDFSLKGDPTPVDPVGLRMAADDNTSNVVYLAQPCQYTDLTGVRACTEALYTTHRYSPQILDAMGAALDNIKARHDAPSFNLVGFGGGAAIAVELAAVRDDVKSLKTVAGNLDTTVLAQGWKENPFAGSLNPVDAAPKVAHIPQTHSVASWDKARSLQMIENFMTAEGNPPTAAIGAPVALDAGENMVESGVTPLPPSTPGQPQSKP